SDTPMRRGYELSRDSWVYDKTRFFHFTSENVNFIEEAIKGLSDKIFPKGMVASHQERLRKQRDAYIESEQKKVWKTATGDALLGVVKSKVEPLCLFYMLGHEPINANWQEISKNPRTLLSVKE